MDYCKIIVQGRMTKDPEIRYSQNGNPVASFSVAVNRKYRKKDSTELSEAVTFIPVRVFGRQAENAGEYLGKGRGVLIDGELRSSEWKGEHGKNNRMLYIATQKIIYLGKPNGKDSGGESDMETDIPF